MATAFHQAETLQIWTQSERDSGVPLKEVILVMEKFGMQGGRLRGRN